MNQIPTRKGRGYRITSLPAITIKIVRLPRFARNDIFLSSLARTFFLGSLQE